MTGVAYPAVGSTARKRARSATLAPASAATPPCGLSQVRHPVQQIWTWFGLPVPANTGAFECGTHQKSM